MNCRKRSVSMEVDSSGPSDSKKKVTIERSADSKNAIIEDVERQFRPTVQQYEVKPRKVGVCTLNLKDAKNVTNGGAIRDFFDAPDPYLEITAHTRHGTLTQQTHVIENTTSPKWNEEIKIIFSPTNDPDIELLLKDSDCFKDDTLAKHRCNISTIPQVIHMKDNTEIRLDTKCHEEKPHDLKCDKGLSEQEVNFIDTRREWIYQRMKTDFDENGPKDIEEVPTIGVIGSGGGFRALIAFSGVVNVLAESGILDYVMFMTGLSGSSWYISTLYSHPDWPNVDPRIVQNEFFKNLCPDMNTLLTCHMFKMEKYLNEIQKKQKHVLPCSFTDLFGQMIAETLIPGRQQETWSEQRRKLEYGKTPLPILSCINVKSDETATDFHEWVEFSPFQMAIPKYGVSLDMKDVGSQFLRGVKNREFEEPPLHFIQGVCGSAYTVLQRHKCFLPSSTLTLIDNLLKRFGIKCLDDRKGRAGEIPNILRQLSMEPIESFDDDLEDEKGAMDCKEKDVINKEYMYLVDAGLAFNSPYPVVLRPERQVNLILSFDFTDRGCDANNGFTELLKAKKWADEHNLPFPEINVCKEDNGLPEELYIFDDPDTPECPIIMHFVLVNNKFHKYKQPGCERKTTEEEAQGCFSIFDDENKPYDSMKFHYTQEEANKLIELMEFNTKLNIDKIKECVKECVRRKQKKRNI